MDALCIGKRNFCRTGKTYCMGILNVTPDSFSDGGKFNAPDRAYFQVEQMIKDGADIIDLGGESTRPNGEAVDADTEAGRVLPILSGIKERFDVPVSLDTYKASVARQGVAHGADMINDVWALRDPEMAAVVKDKPICLMHNNTRCAAEGAIMNEVVSVLQADVARALERGLALSQIILDPGIGFAKTTRDNLIVMHRIGKLHGLGCPLLLGCSRKSVIGKVLNLDVNMREEGTLAATVYAVLQGVQFVRVHNVAANVRVIKMAEAIQNEGAEL